MANGPQSASHANGKGFSLTTPTQSAIQARLDMTPAPRPTQNQLEPTGDNPLTALDSSLKECIVLDKEEDGIFTSMLSLFS